jgi:hypothetical protein
MDLQLNPYMKIRATVKLRPQFNGQAIKPGCLQLEGAVLVLKVAWLQEAGDKYPGEWALTGGDPPSAEMLDSAGICWISSGDVACVSELGRRIGFG